MISLERVLVPTDFSEASDTAIGYAKAMAQAFGGTMHLLHVVEEPFASLDAPVPAYPALSERIQREAGERLATVAAAAELAETQVRLAVKTGHPAVEILRYAKAEAIDLIVMGTHGRGKLAHLLMGSVAERVVRLAPCPVLTVHHPQREFVLP
jgi:nucleotide-binding universal stress UspA family protein